MAGTSGRLILDTTPQRCVMGAGERIAWEQELVFRGVQLREKLRLQLLDKRLIGSDIVLGQVLQLPLHALRDERPRYVVIPMPSPLPARARRGPVARVRVRLQWRADEGLPLGVAGEQGLEVAVMLAGVHVSIVEWADLQFPREIVNITMEGLGLDLYHISEDRGATGGGGIHTGGIHPTPSQQGPTHRRGAGQHGQHSQQQPATTRRWHQSCRVRVHSLQVDNQLLSSDRPVVLTRSTRGFMDVLSGGIAHNMQELKHKTAALAADVHADLHQPLLQVGWEMVQHNESILYFDYFDLLLQVCLVLGGVGVYCCVWEGVVWMCCCVDVLLCGCVVVWMCCCVDVLLCGCVVVWMCCCVDVFGIEKIKT